MRISVNLANRPFVELRPLFARLRLAMGVLAVLAIGLGFALHSLNAKAAVARARMDALKAETYRYQHERQVNEVTDASAAEYGGAGAVAVFECGRLRGRASAGRP